MTSAPAPTPNPAPDAPDAAPANRCPVCDAARAGRLYEGILRCDSCGYVFADMTLSDEELFKIYNEEFFTGAEFSDYASDEKFFRKNFELRFRELRKFIDPARHRRLLEIGSAYGFFLDTVRRHFDSAEGIDITEAGTRHSREQFGLDVTHADFLAHDYARRKFDVVCMWDTIEHLRDPAAYVEKIAAHTEPGALLALTTGDIESLNARLRGRSWRLIHPPTHLHYFSPSTVALLLERHGFEVVYNRHCGFWRSFGNVAYNVLVLRQNRPRLFKPVEWSGLARLGFYLNLYDIMYVIARRR